MNKINLGVIPPLAVLEKFEDPHEDLYAAAGDLLAQASKNHNDISPWAQAAFESPEDATRAALALNRHLNKGEWKGADHAVQVAVQDQDIYFRVAPAKACRRQRIQYIGAGNNGDGAKPRRAAASETKAAAARECKCKTCHEVFKTRFGLGKHYSDYPSHRSAAA